MFYWCIFNNIAINWVLIDNKRKWQEWHVLTEISGRYTMLYHKLHSLFLIRFLEIFTSCNTHTIYKVIELSVSPCKNRATCKKSETCMLRPHQSDNVMSLKDTSPIWKDPYLVCASLDLFRIFSIESWRNEVFGSIICPWNVHFQCISIKL